MQPTRLTALVLLYAALVGCHSEPTVLSGVDAESGLLVVELPDASLLSAEQLETYRRRLSEVEARPGEPPTARGRRFGELGKRLFADGFGAAAEPCFRNALALDPERFDWLYYLGHLDTQNGEAERAIDRFEAALKRRPDDLATWVSLGNALRAAARPARAKQAFDAALERNPSSASALVGLGRAELALENFPAAVSALTKALELEPKASVAHYPLAQALRRMGKVELADEHLELRGAVEVFPIDPLMEEIRSGFGSPFVWNERGRSAFARSDFEAAVGAFRRAAGIAPKDARILANLGSALFRFGDRVVARERLQDARELAPGDADVLFGLGAIEESENRSARAERFYRAALTVDADHPEAHLRLAQLQRGAGNYRAAVENYSAVLVARPRLAVAHLGRAMAWVKLERWENARDALEQAARLLPDQPAFAHAWARVLAAAPDAGVRDGVRALQILDDIVNSGQQNTDIGETIAMALAECGEFERAQEKQTQLLELAAGTADRALLHTMRERLESYRARTPWRRPWPEDHLIFSPPDDAAPAAPRRTVGGA